MSNGVNKVILIGNLGQDPDVRATTSGLAVVNTSLATNIKWKSRETGEQNERTEWHRLVFFGRLAEIAGQIMHKGAKVYVEGRLQTRQWEREGQKQYTTEVVVENFEMLDSRGSADGQARPAPERAAPAPRSGQDGGRRADAPPPPPPEDPDDDIPF